VGYAGAGANKEPAFGIYFNAPYFFASRTVERALNPSVYAVAGIRILGKGIATLNDIIRKRRKLPVLKTAIEINAYIIASKSIGYGVIVSTLQPCDSCIKIPPCRWVSR
jgi:pyrimidine deaminase RibD-like protein